MPQIKITLTGLGGELDSLTLDVPPAEHIEGGPFIQLALIGWLTSEGHILSAGDTITIREVEE